MEGRQRHGFEAAGHVASEVRSLFNSVRGKPKGLTLGWPFLNFLTKVLQNTASRAGIDLTLSPTGSVTFAKYLIPLILEFFICKGKSRLVLQWLA